MPTDVERIKEKLSIVDLLRSYLTLVPAGKHFKANCPFHQEKTPSFMISPERGVWHCFGCGIGGDAITFVMRYEHLEFPEALRFLAERAGIEINTREQQAEREFTVLYDIHRDACDFFRAEYARADTVRAYMEGRGITSATTDAFEVGFAPGGDALTVHLIQKGFAVSDVVRAGLTNKNTKGLYRDRFDARIVFPIMSHVGKVIAFTGRIVPWIETSRPDAPKYLNSPETPIFNKSKALYGFYKTKQEIGRKQTVVVVEGQMDFLAMWQSGVENVVAVSGTGLTEQHAERLRRSADTVIVSFDNDAAGRTALERSVDLLHRFDFHTKVLSLGSYKDPADAAQNGAAVLLNAVEKALPAFTYLFNHYADAGAFSSDLALKKRTIRSLLTHIAAVKSPVERDEWFQRLARVSGISETALRAEYVNVGTNASPAHGDVGKKEDGVSPTLSQKPEDRQSVLTRRILALAFAKPSFMSIVKENSALLPEAYRALIESGEGEQVELLELQGAYLWERASDVDVGKEFKDLLSELEIESLRREQTIVRNTMRRGEEAENNEIVSQAAERFTAIAQRIEELTRSH